MSPLPLGVVASARVGSSALAADTFDRSNGELIGSTASDGTHVWAGDTGAFSITSNQLVASGVDNKYATVDVGTTNMVVTVKMVTRGDYIRLVARYTDSNNFYLLQVSSSGTLMMYKRVAGSWTQLGSTVNNAIGAGETVGLSVNGSTITGLDNGTPVAALTVTDTALTSGNKAGFSDRSSASKTMDDFVVTAP